MKIKIIGGGGHPYGISVTVGQDCKMIEYVQAAVKHQSKRTVTVAEWKEGKSISFRLKANRTSRLAFVFFDK